MTAIQFTSSSSKASIWQQHLIQWQSSGWTQKAYCRENNLSHRQFLYWRARQISSCGMIFSSETHRRATQNDQQIR